MDNRWNTSAGELKDGETLHPWQINPIASMAKSSSFKDCQNQTDIVLFI